MLGCVWGNEHITITAQVNVWSVHNKADRDIEDDVVHGFTLLRLKKIAKKHPIKYNQDKCHNHADQFLVPDGFDPIDNVDTGHGVWTAKCDTC